MKSTNSKKRNILGWLKAFMSSKGNMSVRDFLDNNCTMEDFIKYSSSSMDFEAIRNVFIQQYLYNEGYAELEILQYKVNKVH